MYRPNLSSRRSQQCTTSVWFTLVAAPLLLLQKFLLDRKMVAMLLVRGADLANLRYVRALVSFTAVQALCLSFSQ